MPEWGKKGSLLCPIIMTGLGTCLGAVLGGKGQDGKGNTAEQDIQSPHEQRARGREREGESESQGGTREGST